MEITTGFKIAPQTYHPPNKHHPLQSITTHVTVQEMPLPRDTAMEERNDTGGRDKNRSRGARLLEEAIM